MIHMYRIGLGRNKEGLHAKGASGTFGAERSASRFAAVLRTALDDLGVDTGVCEISTHLDGACDFNV